MDLPAIGYDNYLTHSGVTPTGDGTNPEYAYNWRTDDAWTTGAASGYIEADMTTSHSPDYFAVVGHTLGTRSATIKLQYWTGAAYADIPEATATPSDDTAIMVVFTPVAATKFKLVVTTDGTAVTIAVASFGEVTTLERGLRGGYAPPPLARQDVYLNNISQSGAFTGRSLVRTGCSGQLALSNLSQDWVRVTLDPFITASRTQGWFLLWLEERRPLEAAYCWTTTAPQPSEMGDGQMACTIDYRGTVE